MTKSYRKQLLDVVEQEIFMSERKIKDEEEKLEGLKEQRNDILRELSEDQTSYQAEGGNGEIVFFKGFE